MTILCMLCLAIAGELPRKPFLGTFFLSIMVDTTYLMLR